MDYQDDIPSSSTNTFKDYYVQESDMTSMQDATENCHYPKIIGKSLSLELNFTFSIESATDLDALVERMSPVAVDKIDVGKNIWKE